MKKFRRRSKTFALPALAAAGSALTSAMPWITAGGTAVGAVTGVKGAMDSSEANEIQRQMAKQQAVNDYKAQALEKQKIEATNKLAESINKNQTTSSNPATANAVMSVGNDLSTKAYSEPNLKRKLFGLGKTVTSLMGFSAMPAAKNWGDLKKITMETASSPITGAMTTWGAYGSWQGAKGASSNLKDLKNQLNSMKNLTPPLESQTTSFVNTLNSAANSGVQKSYSDNNNQGSQKTNIKFRQKIYVNKFISGLGNKWYNSGVGKFVNGAGKVAGDMIWDHRNKVIAGVAGGAGMAAVHYGVNKGLQHNMKKNGIDMAAIRDMQKEQQQMYSNTNPGLEERIGRDQFGNITGKEYWTKQINPQGNRTNSPRLVRTESLTRGQKLGHYVKENVAGPMALGMSAMFEIPNVAGYATEKDKLKALSDMARARKGLSPLPTKQQLTNNSGTKQMMQPQQQRQYSFGSGIRNFFKAPVRNTLAKIDSFTGGRGLAGVDNFANRITDAGKKYDSKALQNVGKWVGNHKKLTMAGSIGTGFYVMGKTMDLGEKMVNKPLKAIDPNAYAYDDYKEQAIQ